MLQRFARIGDGRHRRGRPGFRTAEPPSALKKGREHRSLAVGKARHGGNDERRREDHGGRADEGPTHHFGERLTRELHEKKDEDDEKRRGKVRGEGIGLQHIFP